MEVKHATASVYLFARIGGDWRLGMIEHPRLGGVIVPGGHVEAYETPAEAAVREVREETGLEARFVVPPGHGAPGALPQGFPHLLVAAPWWTVEIPVAADNHHAGRHIHIDHHYIAVAEHPGAPVATAEHPLHWITAGRLPDQDTPLDVKLLGGVLFDRIDALAGGGSPER